MQLIGALISFFVGLGILKVLSIKMKFNFIHFTYIWILKSLVSIFFVYFFSDHETNSGIQGDYYNFYNDGYQINQIAYSNPELYLKLIIGINPDSIDLTNSNELVSTQIWDAAENGNWINDNRLIIKINSLIHFISFENIYVHVYFFSFISLLGIILAYCAFKKHIEYKTLFLLTIALFPSISFYGSGLTKESILIFSMGSFFFIIMRILESKFSFKNVLAMIVVLLLLIFNKPYVGAVIIFVSLVLIFGSYLSWKKNGLIFFSLFLILAFIFLGTGPEKINLTKKITYRQTDMNNLAQGGIFFVTDSSFCAFDYSYVSNFDTITNKVVVNKTTQGKYKLFGQDEFHPFEISSSDKYYDLYLMIKPSRSYFETTPIKNSFKTLVLTIPQVLFNTMIRPFPTDNGSNFKWLIFFQNLSLLFLLIFSFLYRKKNMQFEKYLIYFLLISALTILLIIGWTTPVFGAIVRYKTPVDLIIISACFIIINKKLNLTKHEEN